MDTLFDVNDKNSWYFGPMSRQAATEVLMNERESGVFLVRDSSSIAGDYVLCVREDTKISNYIINKIQQQEQIIYRIGVQSFENLPNLLTFYTLHYLDTTPLRRPAQKWLERVIGKFDFKGSDQDDLPFRRGEVLTVIRKDEDQWWTAKNDLGQFGSIPVPYIQKYDECAEEENSIDQSCSTSGGGGLNSIRTSTDSCENSSHCLSASNENSYKKSELNRRLPALARVIQARHPNAYDQTALKLEVDDIIKVTKTNISGQWEGESNGKFGHFPFTHVEFIDDNNFSNEALPDACINKE